MSPFEKCGLHAILWHYNGSTRRSLNPKKGFGAKALRPSSVTYSLLLLSLSEFSVKDINNLFFSSSQL